MGTSRFHPPPQRPRERACFAHTIRTDGILALPSTPSSKTACEHLEPLPGSQQTIGKLTRHA
jgi:hypothetical protein